MKEYILPKSGLARNFKLKKLDENIRPGRNQVLVKHSAIGVNYSDILFRNGTYQIKDFPVKLGMEACGYIEAVGPDVVDYQVGERVAYATAALGSYTQKRVVHQDFLVSPPSDLSDVTVAGSLLKAMMAHTLLFRVYAAAKSKRILVHAAAGGVGQFLCSWAKHLGLEVIGTVGSDQKIPIAKQMGCDYVINYASCDFLKEVSEYTKGQGVGIVYDGVGKDTILKSINCLWPMGMCVSFGDASGLCPPIDLNYLLHNSLYITKPTLTLYKANRIELALSANEVFDKLSKKILRPNIKTYNFEDLVKAHQDLENRKTVGSLVLNCS